LLVNVGRVVEVELTQLHFSEVLDHAGQVADRDLLDRALARLEPEARAVVVLHFYLDIPLPRVAELLGIPGRYRQVTAPPVARGAPVLDGDRRRDVPKRARRTGRMTTNRSRSLERTLPGLFVELAQARTPDYLEAAIERASARSQRPAWTFPERWLPMELVTTREPPTRMPWRQIGVLALIAMLLVAALAVYVGSHQQRLPSPFGIAANGIIAYVRDGKLVTQKPDGSGLVTILPASAAIGASGLTGKGEPRVGRDPGFR
jgi:hypothetical protein